MSASSRFSGAKLQEMRAAFGLFDRDGDGTISVKELGAVLKTMGHQTTEEVVQKMIKVADTDGSGSVEFEEFLEMICDQIEVG